MSGARGVPRPAARQQSLWMRSPPAPPIRSRRMPRRLPPPPCTRVSPRLAAARQLVSVLRPISCQPSHSSCAVSPLGSPTEAPHRNRQPSRELRVDQSANLYIELISSLAPARDPAARAARVHSIDCRRLVSAAGGASRGEMSMSFDSASGIRDRIGPPALRWSWSPTRVPGPGRTTANRLLISKGVTGAGE